MDLNTAWKEDAVNILATPVHPDRDDVVAWHFDSRGVFSVKSAYHTFERATARDRSFQTGESSMQAAHDMEDKLWTQIW